MAAPAPPPLVAAAAALSRAVARLRFGPPVTHVYNPLDYAWPMHAAYLHRYGRGPKRVLLLGMNPGPFGMAQTGVPFGEIPAVRHWLQLDAPISAPKNAHPKRPISGLACPRSEVSGRRLWGLFAERFGTPTAFFRHHLVINHCPLVFMSETGANLTPDKLPAAERNPLTEACDAHLRAVVAATRARHLVGIGAYATGCARRVFGDRGPVITQLLHPSPASPAANRGWAEQATRQLTESGVWPR